MANSFLAYFRLIRPDLTAAAGFCVFLGQILALGSLPTLHLLAAGFISVFCISAAILVSNDIIDLPSDLINAPNRPIPSGLVSLPAAKVLLICLLLVGLVLSFTLSIYSLIIAVLLAIVGFLYNNAGKQTGLPGNLMVSFSVGMTFIYGAASVRQYSNPVVYFFAAVAALFDLGEEILADITDAEGDKKINSKSLAIKYGEKKALNIASAIFISIIPLTALPFLLGWLTIHFVLPLLYLDIAIVYNLKQIHKSPSSTGKKYIISMYRHATVSLVVFIIFRLLL